MDGLKNIIEQLSKSEIFQAIAKKEIKQELSSANSSIRLAAKKNAEWYADKMKEIVAGYMDQYGIGGYSDMNVDINDSANGYTIVNLSFDNTSNLSPSLNPNRDPVVLPRLLNTGFHTKSDVWGYWHGKYTHGLRDRSGLEFIQDAVHEFNTIFKGEAKAEYIQQDSY